MRTKQGDTTMNTDQSNPFAWKFIWDDGEYFYSNKFETIESYAEMGLEKVWPGLRIYCANVGSGTV